MFKTEVNSVEDTGQGTTNVQDERPNTQDVGSYMGDEGFTADGVTAGWRDKTPSGETSTMADTATSTRTDERGSHDSIKTKHTGSNTKHSPLISPVVWAWIPMLVQVKTEEKDAPFGMQNGKLVITSTRDARRTRARMSRYAQRSSCANIASSSSLPSYADV